MAAGAAGGAGAAGAGTCCWAAGLFGNFSMTEASCWRPKKVRVKDVSIKRIATAAVNLARKGAAPVLPKTV